MSAQEKILIIEGDHLLNLQMKGLMVGAGYEVESCFDGESGLFLATEQRYDLVLLDVTLPICSDMTLLVMLRKMTPLPIIVVTAKCSEQERITGLRQGADDYIAKPFNPIELILRVKAVLRRAQPNRLLDHNKVVLDSLVLDSLLQTACVDERDIQLTVTQFKLLWELGVKTGTVLSKSHLSRQVLNKALGSYDRSLDMHLSRVRRKLNDGGWQGARLQTIHGTGYCLT